MKTKLKLSFLCLSILNYLLHIGTDKHEDFLKTLHSKLEVGPVDEIAAVKCAEIGRQRRMMMS
jgi:hypothetical protein